MPVIHSKRAIFVHIPKSAGTSISESFAKAGCHLDFCGENLWPHLYANPRNGEIVRLVRNAMPTSGIRKFPEQHLPASALRALVDDEVWSTYFKFTFVRNPWDLVVSTYTFLQQRNPDQPTVLEAPDFAGFVCNYPILSSDMTTFFTDEHGHDLVDFIGRFETIETDFATVCARLGLAVELHHANRSDHLHYREFYDGQTRRIVERHFARDIDRFGYRF
jgi:sulfotransferase famil protein